jgi:hypothetical protein
MSIVIFIKGGRWFKITSCLIKKSETFLKSIIDPQCQDSNKNGH